MTEFIFINRITTDCMSFHDAIYDNKSLDGGSQTFHCVIAALAYLKLGRDFMLIISPDDFPGEMEPLKTYIMNNNIPYIFRYSEVFIKDNNLGALGHIIDSEANRDVVELAMVNWLARIALNEPASNEITNSDEIIKTPLNSILLYDEFNDGRWELKSEISDMIRKGDWTWCYLDNNTMRKSRKTIDELVAELEDEGMTKVHASEAVCGYKAVNMFYDNGFKIVMPDKRIASVSRKFEYVVPIIRKILEEKGVVVTLREERK